MYPEAGGADLPPAGGGGYFPEPDWKSRIAYNLEGLIPLILILIIAFFLAVKFNIVSSSTPFVGPIANVFGVGSSPVKLLIIGKSSPEVIDVLNKNPDLVVYRMKSPHELERNPKEQISQYDVVMLDQSQEADKAISRRLGDALNSWVKGGGNLVTVMDSGIRRTGLGGQVAFDVVGWQGTIGDVVPVSCDRVGEGQLACENKIIVRGKLTRQIESHAIMSGIEVAPPQEGAFFLLETFDVTPTGTEVAYVSEARGIDSFPGIVEKKMVVGKSVYFNYNPGITQTILENTLKYMRKAI
ncbi:MAG: hypothetical protein J4203_03805 [Candidatus Diapherotrites archaeon]|uniref:Uncharacterized protein n=1 Tax=Candidatus Iainarchaeum sp. TaxID=3101447 RepID=A0A8T4LAK4_9ARCH|nr:hypothetical protein [Candidatus Diapherotrites archaeon]